MNAVIIFNTTIGKKLGFRTFFKIRVGFKVISVNLKNDANSSLTARRLQLVYSFSSCHAVLIPGVDKKSLHCLHLVFFKILLVTKPAI